MAIKFAKKAKCQEDDCLQEESKVHIPTNRFILDKVFALLGKPTHLAPTSGCLTRATKINKTHYRVNIYRQLPYSVLTDSFYVQVDSEGEIVSSNPPIVKKY